MVYICEVCRFLFSRTKPAESCPDCGKEIIREANEAEQKEFERNKEMHGK